MKTRCRWVLGLILTATAFAQPRAPEAKVELLWPNGAPRAVGSEDADKPSITIHPPAAVPSTGAAVVICPGGGYRALAMDHEGQQVARWFNSFGVAAFVLKYRLGPRYRHPAPLEDVQRAIRRVRSGAGEFGVSPDRIGVMGFSAGGHLASTAATHFDSGDPNASEPINRASARPDFAILGYPVITFTENFMHQGSRDSLLGPDPDPKLVESLSNEKQVTPRTPPTFLFHTNEDRGVPPENSVCFYLALRKAGVPAEMHIYEHGPHGVGMAPTDLALSSWPARLAQWMAGRGLLGK